MEETTTAAVGEGSKIAGIGFGSAYVDDYAACFEFYSGVLGLEKLYDMGDQACYFKITEATGFYLQGGNKRLDLPQDATRTSITFEVPSAAAMYAKLKEHDVRFVQDAPMDMGGGFFWFQFFDPSGNMLEILGGK